MTPSRLQPLAKSFLIILALLLLTLPAIHPFLQGAMPLTDDGNLHLYRSIILDHSLRHDGSLYPRYSSGLVYGYGSSLFNYFPPTSYYLTVFLHRLGLAFIPAWLWTMILYVWVAAGGAYALGKIWSDEAGGFLTAAAYVYAPYLLFNTVTRGTSSELAALALLPWVMWALTRLAFYGQRLDFVLAVLTFALFIPMHNIITLQGGLLLLAYCTFLWLSSRQKIRVFTQLLSAGLLAVMMTTFFWLPALAETGYTKINAVVNNLNFIDVTRSLRGLVDVFALPRTADPTQLQAPTPITLGWPQTILGVLGLGLAWWFRIKRRSGDWVQSIASLQTMLFLVVLVGVFLQLNMAALVWETVPLLGYSQFAWRTLGITSLALALMTGLGANLFLHRIGSQSFKFGVFCVFLALLVFYGFPWLYTAYSTPQAETLVDAQNYERQTGQLSLASYSEYLPIATDASTLESDKLLSGFVENHVVPRLSPPEGVMIFEADWQGTSATLRLQAEQATTLVFDWLYVPGWQARFLDETTALVPLTVRPSLPQGFVSVEIPAGTHTLEIVLHDTPYTTYRGMGQYRRRGHFCGGCDFRLVGVEAS